MTPKFFIETKKEGWVGMKLSEIAIDLLKDPIFNVFTAEEKIETLLIVLTGFY